MEWRGSGLEWWALGAGGVVNLRGNVALLGGIRLEHLSLKPEDPVDPFGNLQRLRDTYGDRYSSNFLTKLWIPYFGVQFDGQNYQGKVLFSPVAWANVKIPFSFLFVFMEHGTSFIGFENAEYDFKPNGLWLEGDLQYDMRVRGNLGCNLWFKGSWLQIRGRGREGYEAEGTEHGVPVAPFYDSASANGSYTNYILAGGLSASWAF